MVEELLLEKWDVYKEELDTPTEKSRRGTHNEELELDEGLKDLLNKAGDIARVTLARMKGNGGNIEDISKTLGLSYLDPRRDAQKIIDTAEVLQDIQRFGRREVLKDPYDAELFAAWLQARSTAKANKRKKIGWEKTAFLEEEELDEMSAMGSGAVAGHSGNAKKRKNSLIREEEP